MIANRASGRRERDRHLTGTSFIMAGFALLLVAAGGCRDSGSALGASPAEARANVDALLSALGARFGVAESAPGYDELRGRIGGSALVPSRLFNDSALWMAQGGELRELELGGWPAPTGYLLGARGPVADPRRPGEYRRLIQLRAVAPYHYEWAVRDELAIGPVTPDELGAFLADVLQAAERGDPRGLRAASSSTLPHTTAALGRLFSLDSITIAPHPDGGALLSIAATTHPERIAGEFPQLSRFLRRYATPARVQLRLEDTAGIGWWVATLDRDRMRLAFRVRDGRLRSLDGPPRPMPNEMVLRADLATRFGIFDVGAAELVARVTLDRSSASTGFTASFRREPEWHFPPLVERLIRAPLRRPFEGDGASLGYSIRQSSAGTRVVRDYRIVVQESAILRWLGGLGSTAVSDFRRGAERESDRFNSELFSALRLDARGLLR